MLLLCKLLPMIGGNILRVVDIGAQSAVLLEIKFFEHKTTIGALYSPTYVVKPTLDCSPLKNFKVNNYC